MTGDKATRSKKSTAPISRDASTILNPNNNVNLSQGESGIVASMLTGISEEQGSSTQNQRRPENSDDIMSNSVSNQGQDSQSSVTSATPKQAQRSPATNKSSKLPATLAKNMTTASNINNQDDSSYISLLTKTPAPVQSVIAQTKTVTTHKSSTDNSSITNEEQNKP